MKMIKSINRVLISISKALCMLAGIMLVLMMLITAVDVGLRTFVHSTFAGASVLVRNMLVAAMFLAMPYVTFMGGHTRSEFLYARASRRVQTVLDIFAYAIGMLLFGLMAYAMIRPTVQSVTTQQFDSEGTFIMSMTPFYVCALFGAWFAFYAALHNFIALIGRIIKGEKEDDAA